MLQELQEYARRERLTAEPGLKPKTVRWLLSFSPRGAFLGVLDFSDGDKTSKGREFPACPDLTQQEMVAQGAGCRHFLVDSVDVVCLVTKDGAVDDKLAAKHAYFVGLLEQAAEALPALAVIAQALHDPAVLEQVRAALVEHKAKPTELATVALRDSDTLSILVEGTQWHTWWQRRRQQMVAARRTRSQPARRGKQQGSANAPAQMLCLLSGASVIPQPTHNKIEGLAGVGGLAMGDTLTSFDKDAFTSYGLEQVANAAMSETMVKTYVTALNHLIKNRSHTMVGVKVLYWYSGAVANDDDPLREIFEGTAFALPLEPEGGLSPTPPAEDTHLRFQAESRAKRLLEGIRRGQRPDLASDLRYYALTLSANSGRVVVRDWMEGTFAELVESVNAWFDDLAIIARDGKSLIGSQKFAAVVAAPFRDLKDAPPALVLTLWRCALKRQPIPHHVMAQTLRRVRNDCAAGETPLHGRYALLRAYCNRNERTPSMTVELNEYENDSAYLCGRVLALLANIQRRALGDVGAGVVQRYYAAASATPALVLGRLVRTAQVGHLPKIGEKGLQLWYERQLAEVWNRFTKRPKTTLSLEEQTLFALGYYQQIAKRPDTKAREVDTAAERETV